MAKITAGITLILLAFCFGYYRGQLATMAETAAMFPQVINLQTGSDGPPELGGVGDIMIYTDSTIVRWNGSTWAIIWEEPKP